MVDDIEALRKEWLDIDATLMETVLKLDEEKSNSNPTYRKLKETCSLRNIYTKVVFSLLRLESKNSTNTKTVKFRRILFSIYNGNSE